MFDVVVNHMGSATNPPDFSLFSPFSQQSDFHPEDFITDYNNQTQVEQGWLGDTTVPLADIKTDDPTIANTFYAWITKLVTDHSVDGLRIDTVKNVNKDFFPGFASAAGVFTIGEVSTRYPF
jgi:alpha-amylase